MSFVTVAELADLPLHSLLRTLRKNAVEPWTLQLQLTLMVLELKALELLKKSTNAELAGIDVLQMLVVPIRLMLRKKVESKVLLVI